MFVKISILYIDCMSCSAHIQHCLLLKSNNNINLFCDFIFFTFNSQKFGQLAILPGPVVFFSHSGWIRDNINHIHIYHGFLVVPSCLTLLRIDLPKMLLYMYRLGNNNQNDQKTRYRVRRWSDQTWRDWRDLKRETGEGVV